MTLLLFRGYTSSLPSRPHPTLYHFADAASPPDDRVVSVERRIEISSCSQHHVRAATLIGRDDERC